MKFALCDDDPRSQAVVSDLIKEYVILHPSFPISIFSFSSGEELLENIKQQGKYDLFFLDIVMPGMNGITLGNTLRKQGIHEPIIYLTSSEEYAIESYRVRALDYLLKPIRKEYLFSTLDSIMNQLIHKKEKYIIVKTAEGSLRVPLVQILYAQLSNRVINYYLNDGSIVKSIYLRIRFTEAIASLLEENNFALCGVGMVVNLSQITRLENNSILFSKHFTVPIGTKAFRTLKSLWMDYCINKEDL